MSHGLVQITGGTDLVMRGLRVVGADADGIAVTHVSAVSVENCVVKGRFRCGAFTSTIALAESCTTTA